MVIERAMLLRRITGRRTCKVGGEIYNVYDRPPKCEGRCDSDGGELEQRPDDREEIVAPGSRRTRSKPLRWRHITPAGHAPRHRRSKVSMKWVRAFWILFAKRCNGF